MKNKRLLLLLVCCIGVSFAFAKAKEITNGLLFTSSTDLINNRTSLLLFDDKPEKFKDSFSISFDLSIWDIKQFGYVLRVVNDRKEEVDFVFVNFYGEDNMYLDFHSPITHKSVPIPISKEDIKQKKWIPLRLEFDLVNDQATIFSKDSVYRCQPIGLTNPSVLKFAFGLYGLNLDVPQMAIRNIRIEHNDKALYSFPLNESSGNEIHDANKKIRGLVSNPQWLINRHYHWEQLTCLSSDYAAGITYDSEQDRLFIVNKESIIVYDPSSEIKETKSLQGNPFPVYSGESLYSNNKCYVYNINKADTSTITMAVVDMNNYQIVQQAPKAFPHSSLHHHDVFFGENENELYLFGGFGNYAYSNTLYKYNISENNWDTVSLAGDYIMPRSFSASGKGPSPTEVFIFGGFGNESGRHEHGGRNLYDFFSIDLKTQEVKKRWEVKPVNEEIFVPCGNLIFDKDQSCFYTLCYPHHLATTTLLLYKFNTNDGSYEIVSDSIPIVPEQVNSKVYLFYNETRESFYAATREFVNDTTSEVKVYSLLAPPVTRAQLSTYNKQGSNNTLWLILSGSLSFILLLFILWKRKQIFNKKRLEKLKPGKKELYDLAEYTTVVNVFGDFKVYDKKRQDITYRFSQKIKYLFAIILLHSKENAGISTERITSELWPDKDVNSAKNIRGVTINRLRSILADMQGITLIHQNSQWFFSFDPSFYCDYNESIQLMNQLETSSGEAHKEQMDKLIHIHKKGVLFPNMKGNWLDNCKRDYENKFESILKSYIHFLDSNKSYPELIAASEAYFVIDPLDKEIMNLTLKAYNKLGKKDQARIFFDKFKRTYKELLGEEYEVF